MAMLNLKITARKEFEEQGFTLLQELIPNDLYYSLNEAINERLPKLILMHQYTNHHYFSAVNRWPLKSLISNKLQEKLIRQLTELLVQVTGLKLQVFEADVLYKSFEVNLPTPCHQDIAYAFNRPYLLSSWMPLADVTMDDSPLQFLPGSHHNPIAPAIDFWQPDFIDKFRATPEWQHNAVTIPVGIGGVLVFSSRIWHGSLPHRSFKPRLAIAIRWGIEGYKMSEAIPIAKPVEFGLWNCGDYTQALLQDGLRKLFHYQTEDFTQAIQLWQEQLAKDQFPFVCNKENAQHSLQNLQLLNKAYESYGGGDGQGIIYAQVWKNFLVPLKDYLSIANEHS